MKVSFIFERPKHKYKEEILMNIRKKLVLSVLFTSISSLTFADTCGNSQQATEYYKPYNYNLKKSSNGVCLYKHKNKEIYIHVVDLAAGAKINFKVGKYNYTQTLGNGKKARMYSKKTISYKAPDSNAKTFWDNRTSKTFAMINAQFFDTNRSPTFLSFPTRNYGSIISKENDMRDRSNYSFGTLIINSRSAEVYSKYKANIVNQSAYNKAIVGFNPYLDEPGIRAKSKIGRTFVGVRNGTSSSYGPKPLLIFANASKASTSDMIDIMYDWYVSSSEVVMFDGGGSSQFKSKDGTTMESSRPVPMVFELVSY